MNREIAGLRSFGLEMQLGLSLDAENRRRQGVKWYYLYTVIHNRTGMTTNVTLTSAPALKTSTLTIRDYTLFDHFSICRCVVKKNPSTAGGVKSSRHVGHTRCASMSFVLQLCLLARAICKKQGSIHICLAEVPSTEGLVFPYHKLTYKPWDLCWQFSGTTRMYPFLKSIRGKPIA